MDIYGLYKELGSDGELVMERFMRNESLITRVVKKFIDDTTFSELRDTVMAKDYDGIERNAHTLKGIAANLGFEGLSDAAAEIVSAVRKEKWQTIPELFIEAEKQYDAVITQIRNLD